MFFSPAVLLEHMLRVEAQHEAFYAQFPHLLPLGRFYDQYSSPLKFLLLSLTKANKPTVASES